MRGGVLIFSVMSLLRWLKRWTSQISPDVRGLSHAALAVVCLQGAAPTARSASRPPNIVFILADDLGYGHLGSYGQKIIKTPNLDRLATQGMRFTQACAGAANCAPSRSSLLTGRHGGHTSVRQNDGGIPLAAGEVTLGDVLKSAGYATGCFGKWGLGDADTIGVPWKRGFDEFFGYLHQKHAHFYYTEYLWDNGRKFPLPGNAGGKHGQFSPDVITDRATEFIRKKRDQPFFCYLPFTLPHGEFIAPEESLAEYRGKFEEHPLAVGRVGYANPKEPKATFAAMISHLDRSVGRIMALLDELALTDNTIVVFTSDNGSDNGELVSDGFFHGNGALRGYKHQLYEGGIRVPALVRWPGHIAPGAVSNKAWYFADVMPTLAEVAGAAGRVPANTDGISFVPTLLGDGRPQKEHKYLYWEKRDEKTGDLTQALREGRWKCITVTTAAKQSVELYDLEQDPGEKRDLATLQPEIVVALSKLIRTARFEPPPQIEPSRPPGLDYR